MYHRIYVLQNNEKHWFMNRGMITAFYLMGYGGFRMILETIRTEKVVGMGMTMAQWSMAFFIICGMVFLVGTCYFNRHVEKEHQYQRIR